MASNESSLDSGGNHPTNVLLEARYQRLEDELRELREQMARIAKNQSTDKKSQNSNCGSEEFRVRDQLQHDSSLGEYNTFDEQSSSLVSEEDLIDIRRKQAIRQLQRQLDQLRKEDEIFSKLKQDRNRLLEREQREGSRQLDPPGCDLVPTDEGLPFIARTDWATFSSTRMREEDDLCVIDVLMEDPVITWQTSSGTRNGYFRPYKNKYERFGKHASKQQNWLRNPGRQAMPERIRIHSRHILRILEAVQSGKLFDVDGPLVMTRPFKALAYYGESIRLKLRALEQGFRPREILEGTNVHLEAEDEGDLIDSKTTCEHLRCLVEFMDTYLLEKQQFLASEDCKSAAFTDLWLLFQPGDEVVESTKYRQAYRVVYVGGSAHKSEPPQVSLASKPAQTSLTVTCAYLDFDGTRLGHVTKKFKIEPFEGERVITSLPVYPLRFAPRSEGGQPLRQKLVQRGVMFPDAAKIAHMYHSGLAVETGEEIHGPVIVDFEEAFSPKNKRNWQPVLESLAESSGTRLSSGSDANPCNGTCCINDTVYNDNFVDDLRFKDHIAHFTPNDGTAYPRVLQQVDPITIPKDDLLIMSYRVFGFVLSTRKWGKPDLYL